MASGPEEPLPADLASRTNLADASLGAKVLFATDEWFATADNMLKPSKPHFDPEDFCEQGKVFPRPPSFSPEVIEEA